MSKRDINLLLVAFGLLLVVAVYFIPFTRINVSTQAISDQIALLEPRLKELENHATMEKEYLLQIENIKEYLEAELLRYPAQFTTEDYILYLVGLENQFDAKIETASFAVPWAVKTIENPGKAAYSAYETSATFSYKMDYKDLKRMFYAIAQTPEQTFVDSFSANFDSDSGRLVGSITVNKIFVNDGAATYVPPHVNANNVGVKNPFGTIEAPGN